MADLKRFLGEWNVQQATKFYRSIDRVVIEETGSNEASAHFYRTDKPKARPVLTVELALHDSHLVGHKKVTGRDFAFSVVPGPFRDLLNGASRPLLGSADDPDEVAGTWGAEDAGGHVAQEYGQARAGAAS